MPSPIRPVLFTLLVLGMLGSLWLLSMGPARVFAQEADPEVPLVNVGGALHADLFTGQATGSLPIEVPPGRNGMQPNLALVYGSAHGNGWLGMGWKLEQGAIERQLTFGVDYAADDYVFRLNGVNMELVNIGDEEYRAKIEGGFTRIEKTTEASPDGLPYFVATDKQGTTYVFGKTARVRHPDFPERIVRWCLERVEDTNGNYMELQYQSDQGQAYLSEIAYTGHEGLGVPPTNKILFHLEDRGDAPTLYTTHFPVTTAKRLKIIEVRANGQLVRAYELHYTEGLAVTGRSLLTKLEHYGQEANVNPEGGYVAGVDTWPTMRFDYHAPPLSHTEVGVLGFPQYSVLAPDLNGDGRADVAVVPNQPNVDPVTALITVTEGDSPPPPARPVLEWECGASGIYPHGAGGVCRYQR